MKALQTTKSTKALFLPLKREFFEAFDNGSKFCEYRLEGQRWNARTCTPGRAIVLSLGYGKARRLRGTISTYQSLMLFECPFTVRVSLRGLYGLRSQDDCRKIAAIRISISKPK